MHPPVIEQFLGRPCARDPNNWPTLLDEVGWEAAVKQIALDNLDLACTLEHDMMYVQPNPLPGRRDISSHIPTADQSPDPVEAVRKRTEAEAAAWSPPSDETMLIYTFLKKEMQQRDIDLLTERQSGDEQLVLRAKRAMAIALALLEEQSRPLDEQAAEPKSDEEAGEEAYTE